MGDSDRSPVSQSGKGKNTMLKLKKYQVTGFRSVKDSGWIETDNVTALIGVNESGKTNLIMPLWKLNPANEGKVVPLTDYPRGEYSDLRQQDKGRVFVRAQFESDAEFVKELSKLTGLPAESFKTVEMARRFDEQWQITFPDAAPPRVIQRSEIDVLLAGAKRDLEADSSNDILRASLLAAIVAAVNLALSSGDQLSRAQIEEVVEKLGEAPTEGSPESTLAIRFKTLVAAVSTAAERLGLVHPNDNKAARQLALKHLPKFVYYSNYGNLDSEIYLPHVIENLKREGLGSKEEAKARTLRVLFEFVGLKAEEILDLGKPVLVAGGAKPTDDQIAAAAQRTKERSVLLQSAGAKLTKEFRNWWKQGDYRFRFEADGDHFRIWVSDDKRPEEVELESRSTGLQWFLSFFLVFLVESANAHEDSILLLDEPGLSLHPLGQKDLSAFFDGLADTNQLLFTTHSPFLIDPDRLDRVRAVYVDPTGATAISADLRAGKAASPEFKSVYAVHSALGLSVSDALLQGCTNVIVEGPSDQLYMTGIKTILIALGKIKPQRELLFFPGGGAKGVNAFVPIFTGKAEAPPHVVLDSDRQGLDFAKKLREGAIYAGNHTERVRNIGDLLPGVANAEVEDLIPHAMMVEVAGRLYRGTDDDFRDVAKPSEAIVPQIEQYATANGIELEIGWKVDLARAVKQRLIKTPDECPADSVEVWVKLFEPFSGSDEVRKDPVKERKQKGRA